MKKSLFALIGLIGICLDSFAQSQPGNIDIGLFNNGTNGSNAASGASLEIALKRNAAYTPIPVAEDFIFILKAPSSDFNKLTDVINLVQHNASLYTATGSMTTQQALDLTDLGAPDDGFVYFPIVLNSTGIGVNVSALTTSWSFAYTFSFSPAKTSTQLQGLRIVDQTNNAQLAAALIALGSSPTDTYTRLLIAGTNQLSLGAFTILPVTFSKYNLTCSDKGAILTWTTSYEQNTSKFEIQKSLDGNNWETIDQVAAAGNSNDQKNYQYLDLNGGTAFYRIRQVDNDGRFEYTSVKRADCKKTQYDVALYPVPAKDNLSVVIRSDNASRTELQIMDMLGKTLQRVPAQINRGNNNFNLNVSELPAGQYMLVGSDPSIQINKKFTIIR